MCLKQGSRLANKQARESLLLDCYYLGPSGYLLDLAVTSIS
jgi:hypothetical protein